MPALAELQRTLARSLLAGDAAGRAVPESWFRGTAAARDGLRVHRNTIVGACWNALRLSYPALERWLGEAAFEALAADYSRAQPPTTAALTAYGESFADFVARHVNDADRALALDIARFDWAFERVARSAPGFGQAPAQLLQPGVVLTIAPSLRLHTAQGPVDEWREQLLRGEGLPGRPPAAAGNWALWRQPEGVAVRRLHAASATLLAALQSGAGFEMALQSATVAYATDAAVSSGATDASTPIAAVLASEVLQASFARISVDETIQG